MSTETKPRPYRQGAVRATLKEEVYAAISLLASVGTYPSARAIRELVSDGYEDLILALRSELVAEGRISLGRSPRLDPIRRDPEARDRTKSQVFRAVLALQVEGFYPSIRAIQARIPEVRDALIYELRQELIDDGSIAIGRDRQAAARGLDGESDASRAAIEARRLMVDAEKAGRGEEPYRHGEARR